MMLRTRLLRAALVVAAALLLSCRVSPTGKLVGIPLGGEPFRMVRSAHFTLRIEASEAEARAVSIELEKSYRLLADLAFPMEKDPDLHTNVILFRSEEDYKRVGPKGSDGVYTPRFPGTEGSTFLSYGGMSPRSRGILVHELSHRFIRYAFPQVPVWLNEGLAEYFQTIAVRGGKAVLGERPVTLVTGADWSGGVPIDALPTFESLRSMDPKAFYAARAIPDGAEGTSVAEEALHRQRAAYASAWAMVHALRNESPGGASRLQLWLEKMAAGQPAAAAFDEAFTGVSAADLETLRRSFTESCAARKVTLLATEYSAAEESPGEIREMRPAEVDALWGWALLWRGRESDRPEVRKRALAAVEAEPTLADAHLLKAAYHELKYDDAGELAETRLAVEAAPDDELAAKALFAIQASSSRDGARGEAEKILAKWLPRAKTASLLNGFAWYMTLHGSAEKAVPIARRSAEIDPSCHECFDTVALALLRTGRYDTALEVEQIAAGIAGERPDAKLYFETIDLFRAVSTQVVLWKKRPEAGSDKALLPPALVRAIAAAQSGGARGCRSLAKESSSSGVVVVRAEVGKDGKVTSAAEIPAAEWDSLAEKPAHPALEDEAVRKCVVEQVQSARFPESGAPTKFTFPYTVQLTSGW